MGYAMPLELWTQAAMLGMRIIEIPVPLIYLDLSRSFGGALDDGGVRLQHYNEVIDSSIRAMVQRGYTLPSPAPALSWGMLLVTESVLSIKEQVRAPKGNNQAAIAPLRHDLARVLETNRQYWQSPEVPVWVRDLRRHARQQLIPVVRDYMFSYLPRIAMSTPSRS